MRRLIKYQESFLFAIIAVLSVVITCINRNFLTLENMFDLLKSYSFNGIMAVGMLFVLISGGIDMSFAAIATVSEYVMAVFMIKYGGNIFLCFLIASIVGAALGFINGLLIGKFKIPAIIATIATMNIFYGLLVIITGGKWIHSMPEWFRNFAMIQVISLKNSDGADYGLSIITFIWFLVMGLAIFILRFTLFGRGLYACGGDRKSALRVGFNVERTEVLVYTIMGLLSGVAGVVQGLLVQTVAPNSIVGKELNIIAAVVLGGASLAGGRGSMLGVFLGLVLLAIVKNGMTLMAIRPVWYEFFVGIVILVSIGATSWQARSEKKKIGAICTETTERKND